MLCFVWPKFQFKTHYCSTTILYPALSLSHFILLVPYFEGTWSLGYSDEHWISRLNKTWYRSHAINQKWIETGLLARLIKWVEYKCFNVHHHKLVLPLVAKEPPVSHPTGILIGVDYGRTPMWLVPDSLHKPFFREWIKNREGWCTSKLDSKRCIMRCEGTYNRTWCWASVKLLCFRSCTLCWIVFSN